MVTIEMKRSRHGEPYWWATAEWGASQVSTSYSTGQKWTVRVRILWALIQYKVLGQVRWWG